MLRKNVAGQHFGFVMLNSSTGAALTGATVTAYRSIDGAAQVAATGTVTETANGQYSFAPSQADTNGNEIAFLFTAASALPININIVTTACDPTSAASFGITNLDTNVGSRSTYAGGAVASVTAGVTVATNSDKTGYSLTVTPPTAAAIATAVWTDTTGSDFSAASSPGKILVTQLGGAFTTTSSSVYSTASLVNAPTGGSAPTAAAIAMAVWTDTTAGDFTVANSPGKAIMSTGVPVSGTVIVATNNDKTGYALSSAGLDAIVIETGVNARQALSPILAACAGTLTIPSGAGTAQLNSPAGTNRASITVDGAGNRTASTLHLPA